MELGSLLHHLFIYLFILSSTRLLIYSVLAAKCPALGRSWGCHRDSSGRVLLLLVRWRVTWGPGRGARAACENRTTPLGVRGSGGPEDEEGQHPGEGKAEGVE